MSTYEVRAASSKALDQNNNDPLRGCTERASTLCLIYAAAFGIYSFTSYEFIKKYLPSLTLIENLWPRLIFNTVPFILLGLYLKKSKLNSHYKVYLWAIAMPFIFLVACLIYTWPIIWSGSADLYLYVHAPNTFIIATSLIIVAPPPRVLFAQVTAFFVLFIIPICTIFVHTQRLDLFRWSMNDLAIALTVSIYAALVIHKLRLKVHMIEIQKQKDASSFLGSAVAKAIFHERSDLLKNRQVKALVVRIDMRGSTLFANSNNEELVATFMSEYSYMVSHCVGKAGGFWNKSIGDGHLVTFGAMDFDNDLSDIPGIQSENESAELQLKRKRFENALEAIISIIYEFEILKEKYDIQETLSLGVAIDYGQVFVRLQGDAKYRTELEITGRVLYRCTRLEEYTKVIQSKLDIKTSILVLSPALEEFAGANRFHTWPTTGNNTPIKDYPDIKIIHYLTVKNQTEHNNLIFKLRAS